MIALEFIKAQNTIIVMCFHRYICDYIHIPDEYIFDLNIIKSRAVHICSQLCKIDKINQSII